MDVVVVTFVELWLWSCWSCGYGCGSGCGVVMDVAVVVDVVVVTFVRHGEPSTS